MELVCRFGYIITEEDLKQVLNQKIGLVKNMYIKQGTDAWKFVCDYHCQEDIDSDTLLYNEEGFDVKIEKEEYKWLHLNSFIDDVDWILCSMGMKEIGITNMGHFYILLYHANLGFKHHSNGNFCCEIRDNFEVTLEDMDVLITLKNVLNVEENPRWHIMSVYD